MLASLACATRQPSPQLVQARDGYDQARNGEPGDLVPDLVYEAKLALDRAERAHERDPGDEREQHLAYLAQRRTQIAVAVAQERSAANDQVAATRTHETVLLAQRDAAQSEAASAGSRLASEVGKRRDAEQAAQKALADLAQMASVRAEAGRTVITLSGEVLFTSGEATLLPAAKTRLDVVATALGSPGADKRIVVFGHTDAHGKSAFNQALSQRRADAVREYLVSAGIEPGSIQAVGKGELEPIANNGSAEGRANNRRVEIVIDDQSARGDTTKTQ